MVERVEALRFVRWPALDGADLSWLLVGLLLVVSVGGGLWMSRKAPQVARERRSAPS
jgi:hypothetical protein